MADQLETVQILSNLPAEIRCIINDYIYPDYLANLPAEVRWMIYRYLFPSILVLQPDIILIDALYRGSAHYAASDSRGWMLDLLTRQATTVSTTSPWDEMIAVTRVMSASTALRNELVVHVARCFMFNLVWDVPMYNFMRTLRPSDTLFVQHLEVPVDYRYENLCLTFRNFQHLKTIVVSHCNGSLDSAINGTIWNHHHLYRLREIETACSQLTSAGFWPEFASLPLGSPPSLWSASVELSSGGHGRASTAQLNVNAEYSKWGRSWGTDMY